MMRTAVLVVAIAACHRHVIILDKRPADMVHAHERREHYLGHLVGDNAIRLGLLCDGKIARMYLRDVWYARRANKTSIYCVAK